MPWSSNAINGGFSDAEPWLPTGPDHAALAVNRQDGDPDSLLNLTRRLVRLRAETPALAVGDLTLLHADDRLLAFERREGPSACSACSIWATCP